jgi:hypothetical protein
MGALSCRIDKLTHYGKSKWVKYILKVAVKEVGQWKIYYDK